MDGGSAKLTGEMMATGIQTQPVKPKVHWYTSEPVVRLMAARRDYHLQQTEEVNPIIYYQIPFPWVRTKLTPHRFYEMSADGKEWIPAQFPHISSGYPSGCMQAGRFEFREQDPLASITEYVVSYVDQPIKEYWNALFKVEKNKAEEKSKDRYSFYGLRDIDPAPFMEAWEKQTLDGILEFVAKQSQ